MFEIAFRTDVGGSNKGNDDYILINDQVFQNDNGFIRSSGRTIISVADGVGGENGGDIAAKETLDLFKEIYEYDLINEEIINQTICSINEHIKTIQKQQIEFYKMSTTITGAIFDTDQFWVFNVGDSRTYRYRNGFISLLTEDHSLTRQYRDYGMELTEEIKHIITRCVGGDNSDPDIFCGRVVKQDDIFIVCSDGLHDCVSDREIETIIMNDKENVVNICNNLYDKAISNGTQDNTSIIVARKE